MVKRIATSLALVLVVCAITFLMILLVPGDPAVTVAGPDATPAEISQTRERLGLDDALPVQFGRWLVGVSTGDLGTSLQGGADVASLVTSRLPVTVGLALVSILLSVLVAVPAGVIAGIRQGSGLDRGITLLTSLGMAIPSFWLGLMLVIGLSLYAQVLPSSGYVAFGEDPVQWFRHILLPAVTLAAAPAAEIARQIRASMVDVMQQDYIRTARAKGLASSAVVLKHALKNTGVPAMTMVGLQLTFLLGGSVIVEQIFGIPGMGALSVTAVLQRDIPVIQGTVLMAAIAVLAVNLLVDLSYRYFNPRIRIA